MAQSGVPARRAAARLLDEIIGNNRLMSEMTGSPWFEGLAPEDRARAQRLASDTLRNLPKVDRVLKDYLKKPPILQVHNVLRITATELCRGGAAHGVVNDAVTIVAANRRTKGLKGLVNAVLRKVAADGPRRWKELPSPRLPDWLRGPLSEAYGKVAMAAMERVQSETPPLDLTPKDGDAGKLAAAVGGDALPTGSVRVSGPVQVSKLPGFAEGDWWVQDAAAAMPVQVLDPKPGESVLDLCAAPGGKTLQLASAGAKVTALDISPDRMARVEENLTRTSLSAECVTGDALEFTGGPYDAILLDAPCSATGTLRRHPDLPYAKDGSEFAALIALQAEMLDHALGLLKPGGRLVYCTCSLLPDEGECQTDEALARHPGLTVERAALDRPGIDPDWITAEGGLRLRPDFWGENGGMDGFYIVALQKPA